MDEKIYQIAEQIVQLHRKSMRFICHWLKMCAAELCQKMNCHICLIMCWILLVMRKYWDYIKECVEDICIYILVHCIIDF